MNICPHQGKNLMAIVKLGGGNFAKLDALPGFHKWKERNMLFRPTGANIQYILNNWPEAEWIGGTLSHKESYERSLGVAEEIIQMKEGKAVVPDTSDYTYKRPPMDHQRTAFALSRNKETFGLFMEQGTGKTKVTLDTACYLFLEKKIDMLIIVAWPNGVHRNWLENELPVDMSVPYVAEYWSKNWKAKYRQKEFDHLLGEEIPRDTMRVLSFNVEAFVSDGAKDLITKALKKFRCLFVIDQSASIKNHSAKRTKFLLSQAHLAPYRRILDGQPVAEGGHELFAQFKFLDENIIGHDTWTAFKAEFCIEGYFNQIAGYKNIDELHSRIDGHCYRVRADDCLDLPPRVYKKWSFDLGDVERRVFDEMKHNSLTYFLEDGQEEGEVLEEELAMVKNLRLQQISSGWWPKSSPAKSLEKTGPSRAKALKALLADVEGKAIIYSRFRPDLELIQEMLGDEAVAYHGGISEEDREEAKRQFMDMDSKVKYFIGQPRTAGVGHTLTAASHVIFYTNDPSLRFREECEKRAHRHGLKHRLFVWDLIATGTQDLKTVVALRSKKRLANTILKDLDGFFLEYE